MWKVLAGVAIGVGGVAAAPFTGGGSVLGATTLFASLSGAGTFAAAVGAGAIGGAIGANLSDGNEELIRQQGYQDGYKTGRAETKAVLDSFDSTLDQTVEKFGEMIKHFNIVIAMTAVAVSCANSKGYLSSEERSDIEMFINGVSGSGLPDWIKQRFQDIYAHPPSITEAFTLAKNSKIDLEVFDELVALTVRADCLVQEKEMIFLEAWNRLRNAQPSGEPM